MFQGLVFYFGQGVVWSCGMNANMRLSASWSAHEFSFVLFYYLDIFFSLHLKRNRVHIPKDGPTTQTKPL